jgi:hypothetical protein
LFSISALVRPFLALLSFYILVITRLRYVYLSTVGWTAWNCSRSPIRRIIFAACTAIVELQSMRLMSTHGRLPAHISCRSSSQSLRSRRTWRTVWGPYPHWHWSVSTLLIACRYALRPILPVRICVMAELRRTAPSTIILCKDHWTIYKRSNSSQANQVSEEETKNKER